MSAFIVGRAHIDVLVDLAVNGPKGFHPNWSVYYVVADATSSAGYRSIHTREDPDAIGRMLLAENIRSVRYRYTDGPTDDLPGFEAATYRYRRPTARLTVVEGLRRRESSRDDGPGVALGPRDGSHLMGEVIPHLSIRDTRTEGPMDHELVYAHTADRAVRDGLLVRVPDHMAKEAGFKVPVLLTAALNREVEVPEGMEGLQDYTGRLWDVLWIASYCFRSGDPGDRMRTNIKVLFANRPCQADLVTIWGVIDGAGLTLMLPSDY
ncbi:MAG: hypothetical protein C0498_01240 [Anaerolinea sp.]|nr:hypothetical protein [Anaerolinea sp.]